MVAILPLGSLLVGLLRTVIRQVTFFTTTETLAGSARGTSLHNSIVMRSLSWCRLTTLLLVLVALGVLTTIPLIGWSLEPLLETLLRIGARTGITSRGLSLKPPLLGLHFSALIVNNNSVIHQRLNIRVCVGHKLELQAIIKSFEEVVLLLTILSYIIWSIA